MKKAVFLFFWFAAGWFVACWFAAPSALAESPNDILVVANKALTANRISESELIDIFLRRKENWHTGLRAVPVQAKDAGLRADFCQRLLRMSRSDEVRFWQQYQIKTGKTQPASFSNTLKAVYKLRGAVSYIYRSQYLEGVAKVVFVLPAN